MIDSHAHLYWDSFKEDFDEMLQRAVDAGLTSIINIGVDLETSKKALQQVQEINKLKVFSTIGLHPGDYLDTPSSINHVSIQDTINKLEQLYRGSDGKIVAVGECGLDYYSPGSPVTDEIKRSQRQLFKLQIELARKLNLPLVIHCRSSWEEIFDYLDSDLKGVFHCWSGSYDDAQKALSLGFYVSFAANITYPKAHSLRQVAQLIPLDRILIETDSPFLSPEGKRGTRNEPANVLEVAKTVAEIRGISLQEVDQATTANTKQLFEI